MSYKSNFYVTLPSNGSKKYYETNTASVFRNKLADPLEVLGPWEVALVEIQYPNTWSMLRQTNRVGFLIPRQDTNGTYGPMKAQVPFNCPDAFDYIMFVEQVQSVHEYWGTFSTRIKTGALKDLLEFTPKNPCEREILVIPNGRDQVLVVIIPPQLTRRYKTYDYSLNELSPQFYYSAQHLQQLMLDKASADWGIGLAEDPPRPPIRPLRQRTEIDPRLINFESNYDVVMVRFQNESAEISRIMGWPKINKAVTYDALPLPLSCTRPQLKIASPAFYVYTDIVETEHVGDNKAPLLRAVPVEGEMGATMNKEFIRPYYKPLTRGYISSILIEIKDDTGKDVYFTEGKVICKLHFRRCGLAV